MDNFLPTTCSFINVFVGLKERMCDTNSNSRWASRSQWSEEKFNSNNHHCQHFY